MHNRTLSAYLRVTRLKAPAHLTFIRLASTAPDFPPDPECWMAVKCWLQAKGSTRRAICSARTVWDRFESWRKHVPKRTG